MKEINKVAIYLRLSRDEENKGIEEILANHRKILIELCVKNSWKYDVYEEIASSIDRNREQLNLMLEKVEKHEYDAVVVHAVDRLSRSSFDGPEIRKILFMADTAIVTPIRIYDWSKDEDMLLLDIEQVMAAQEYRMIKRRMTSGKLAASKAGLFVHGKPPLGYDKDKKTRKLVPNEKAEHIEFIFNSIIAGKTVSDVYHELNKMGLKTRTNSEFTFNGILRIVNNEAYRGALVSNKYDGKNKTKPKSEWHYVENAHPAIIDNETWYKANKIANNYSFSAPRSKNKIYPTTKLIYCAVCSKVQGSQYYPHLDKFYLKMCARCKNRTYLYEPILKIIKEEIARHIPKLLEQINEIKENDNTVENEYKKAQIEKQIKAAEKAIIKAREGYEAEVYTLVEYRETKSKRETLIQEMKAELREIEAQKPQDRIADLNQMKEKVEYLLQNWECIDGDGLTDEEVNRALHFIIEKITWRYDKGEDAVPELNIVYKRP